MGPRVNRPYLVKGRSKHTKAQGCEKGDFGDPHGHWSKDHDCEKSISFSKTLGHGTQCKVDLDHGFVRD